MEHCTDNWATGSSFSLPVKKSKCLEMCNIKHSNWEKECKDQVQMLTDVYIAEQGNLANTKKCQQIHCKDFPATMVAKDDEAKEIEKEGCKDQCTKEQIEAKCQIRWGLQEDVERVKFQDECRKETKEGTLEPCKDDGMKKCDDAEKKCQDEAKAAGEDSMIGANADSICGVRKQVCNDKLTAKCMAAHKKDLKKVAKDCLKEHKEEQKKCLKEKMSGKEDEYKKECFDEIK